MLERQVRQQDIFKFIMRQNKIKKLEGPTETVSNSNDGSITWTVVKEVKEDVSKEVREKNELQFSSKEFLIL